MGDERPECACCAPPREAEVLSGSAACDVPAASGESASAGIRDGNGSDQDWVAESCTLPTAQRPARRAEFDALFTGAVLAVSRPEPTRLRLTVDPQWEAIARSLAERESQCCTFFTFGFGRDAGKLYMDIAVPDDREPILDAILRQATEADR